MKISLGALVGRWSRSATMAFYDTVALSSVDVVYIGVAIHGTLAGLQERDCLALAHELALGGKEVVLSVHAGSANRDADCVHTWIEDTDLPVEVGDAWTLRLLAGKVPLVIGAGVPCTGGADLKRLLDLGARRWVLPAVCKGEVIQNLAHAGDGNADCEIELPVLSPRPFSRWNCRVESCSYEGWARHAMPGCDRDASSAHLVPDWASDLDTLRALGVAILRLTPRAAGTVGLSQTLADLLRGEVDARDAFATYAASLRRGRMRVPPGLIE
ncbi:hypothetical protein [Paraburkholderia heleia]|uniref:hypothetical protein n=1 Tax=Paraburkholderia heleia TaxID=634127 RepID=UPI0005A7213F|nr:hypothetical protein [Paraburkholderia heleia]